MNKKEIKTKATLGIFWFVLITSFIIVAIGIQLKANGYKINWKTLKLVQTGMISLDSVPDSAQVKINGKTDSQTLPRKIRDLAPGYYDVIISAPGYQPWQKTILVQPGKASLYQYIVLFLEKPEEAVVPTGITNENLKNDFQSQSQNLKISSSEIYFQDKLVTRSSQNIAGAILYPDNNHIVFQQNNEIRAVDTDGSNNLLLFKLSASTSSSFILKNNGKTIYYLDQDKILGKNIN
ncbi:MAG: PEGA domain-containing protein [Patescibacteria group bacterium]|nr:PEGA domain-containing protein [Patescibacteria group bacterium]